MRATRPRTRCTSASPRAPASRRTGRSGAGCSAKGGPARCSEAASGQAAHEGRGDVHGYGLL